MNVKKNIAVKEETQACRDSNILISGILLQRSNQLSLQANWKLVIILARNIPAII